MTARDPAKVGVNVVRTDLIFHFKHFKETLFDLGLAFDQLTFPTWPAFPSPPLVFAEALLGCSGLSLLARLGMLGGGAGGE